MRKHLAAVIVVGSLGWLAGPANAERSNNEETVAPVAVQRVSVPNTGLRDEAAMVLVGTALIGLAAAVRRAA